MCVVHCTRTFWLGAFETKKLTVQNFHFEYLSKFYFYTTLCTTWPSAESTSLRLQNVRCSRLESKSFKQNNKKKVLTYLKISKLELFLACVHFAKFLVLYIWKRESESETHTAWSFCKITHIVCEQRPYILNNYDVTTLRIAFMSPPLDCVAKFFRRNYPTFLELSTAYRLYTMYTIHMDSILYGSTLCIWPLCVVNRTLHQTRFYRYFLSSFRFCFIQ